MPKRRPNWSSAWRLWPAPSVRAAVENLARRENQSVAVLIERLVVEALHSRVAAEPASITSTT
jgi:hypothetical protein